ncbi:MAG: ABC transporter substrate-binding protein [Chloroflexi bacterium]|nr:ABC transporter substrate-binding protein [Chloroflexota bacterium]
MKKFALFAALALMLALIAACAPAPTATPAATVAPTKAPAPTTAPTAAPATVAAPKPPASKGANVDEVVFYEEPDSAKAVSIIEAGDMSLYGFAISDPKIYAKLKDSKTAVGDPSYGSTSELTFNPAGPTFKDGRLNPFSVAAIREAMNMLIDRNYIAKEIYGGLAIPMFTTFNPVFPDYAKNADIVKTLEIKYAYDAKKAKEVIDAEMKKLGAELTAGKWNFQGKPVTLIIIIRTEDERRAIGDYLGKQLEDIGFTVDRQYKTAAESTPLWLNADPADGKMHMYTGGWISTVVNRDLAGNFDFYYTPRGRSDSLWQGYKPAADFNKVAEELALSKFTTLAERQKLIAQALPLSLKDSVRIFLINRLSVNVRKADLNVASDLAGGISGSWLWPTTIQTAGKTGGQIRFGAPSILTQPWNPVAGSNFIYDTMIVRSTGELGAFPDPYTGLRWPQRLEKAEVTVQQGLPVGKTLDWVSLNFAPTIEVPKDAWTGWDAEKQQFITVGEKYTQTLTAKTKTVLYYDKDMFKMKWHDGSPMSVGDFVMGMIMTFDRPNEKSAIYDAAAAPAFRAFTQNFRGWRIVSQNPLVVESYSDTFFLDAELIANARDVYPYYSQGIGAWHTIALGVQADGAKEAVFSTAKAATLKVEWQNWIAGPVLKVLEKHLANSISKGTIPYAATLGKFVTADEAKARYGNLDKFYKERGHFWVGNGPFYLHQVRSTEKILTLRKWAEFPDVGDKWARFAAPQISTVAVSGPTRVTSGQAAEFSVKVTYKNQPYAQKDIDFVKFILVDATGNVGLSGDAKAVKDGEWAVSLTAAQTNALAAGSNRLEVVAVSKLVAIPTSESFTFVTLK